jgi:hypothetical protein
VPIEAILLKKTKNLVSRPETLFFIDATCLSRPLRQKGLERFAPGAGAIRPRGGGKRSTPWEKYFCAKMSRREGLRFQHRPDEVFVDAPHERDLADTNVRREGVGSAEPPR